MKPIKINMEHLLINRYIHLLAVIVISILCFPFLSHRQFPLGISLIKLFFVFAVIATLRAVIPEKKKLKLYIAIALIGFGLDVISNALPPGWNIFGWIFSVLVFIIFATFLSRSILIILKLLFQSQDVSLDTILGGVCVYFLLGILWSVLFNLLNYIQPDTFPDVERVQIFYFSFTPLTPPFGGLYYDQGGSVFGADPGPFSMPICKRRSKSAAGGGPKPRHSGPT